YNPLGGGMPHPLAKGDFTGDGKLDLAVLNADNSSLSVLLGKGDGTFADPIQLSIGLAPTSLVAGDFTGDGRLDLVVADPHGTGCVLLLPGNGDRTFAAPLAYAAGYYPYRLATGDFNGDGRLDLVTDGGSPDLAIGGPGTRFGVSVLLADPRGGFQAPTT